MSRLHIPLHLRWADLDALNHVNNATMLSLLEEARIRAFWAPQPGESAPPTAVLDSGFHSGMLTLIARQEIEYLTPVPYGREPLDVQMWFGRIGGSSIEIWYEVFSPAGAAEGRTQTLYARAMSVLVKVSADTGRPVRITPEERAVWEPHVAPPREFSRRR